MKDVERFKLLTLNDNFDKGCYGITYGCIKSIGLLSSNADVRHGITWLDVRLLDSIGRT